MGRGNTAPPQAVGNSASLSEAMFPREQRAIARLYDPEVASEANGYPRKRRGTMPFCAW